MSTPDADLLAAFAAEFRDGTARLAAQSDAAAAVRHLANLRAMVEAVGLASLLAPLERADAAAESGDLPGLHAAAIEMRAALDAALAPPAAPVRHRVRTLLVDDSPTMRRILREVLAADPDFEVVAEAADGVEGLARCAEIAPDLILLDIEMPRMDGLTMLRHWALQGEGAVLVVSSATAPGAALSREVRRLGATGVTGKPSGAISADLAERRGTALLAAARHAAGLPPAAGGRA